MAEQRVEEAKLVQLIVFNLGEEEFGVRIDEIREVIRVGTITPIPDSPEFIKGVTNVRGEIVSVIDLTARFFLHVAKKVESKHIIITEQEKSLFGLMVDEVTEVLRIPESEVKEAPEIVTRIHEEYVNGVVTLENRLIIMLNLSKVLSEDELVELTEVARKSRASEASRGEKAKKEEPKPPEPSLPRESAQSPRKSQWINGGKLNEEDINR